jgi:hypothetical protein
VFRLERDDAAIELKKGNRRENDGGCGCAERKSPADSGN